MNESFKTLWTLFLRDLWVVLLALGHMFSWKSPKYGETPGPIGWGIFMDILVLVFTGALVLFKAVLGADLTWVQVLSPIWFSTLVELLFLVVFALVPPVRNRIRREIFEAYGRYLY